MKRPTLMVLTFLALVRTLSAQVTTAATGGWNHEAAAAYLDQRMDEWFAKGDKLRTGTGQTTCVSCHTVIPYALARPALRRAMRISAPTPEEARLLDETARRVQADDSQQADGAWEWLDVGLEPFESVGSAYNGAAFAALAVQLPVVEKGLQWLRANQLPVRAGDREWPAWRAHSLNYDREHGGSRGEPWRRLFMSDAATAFASLALSASE